MDNFSHHICRDCITAWLPPIINESTEYYNGQEGEQEVAIEGSRLKTAYAEAMRQNALTPSLVKNVWDNLKDGLEMTVGILPSILSIGFRTDCSELYTIY